MGTYSTAFKSGTFDGAPTAGATTFTVAGFTPAAGDIGRFIIATNGAALLQIREITGISGQDITIAHAWDEAAFAGITDSLPGSGDTCAVSYDADDLIATDADLTLTDNNLDIAVLETTGDAYIHFKDYNITFNSGDIALGEGSGMICGSYGYTTGEDAYLRQACNIVDTISGIGDNQMARGITSGLDFGLFHMYGGNIRNASINFWRMYDFSTTPDNVDVRMVGVSAFGGFGSNIAGDKSIVIAQVTDAPTILGFSNFLTIARIELGASNSDQVLYINRGLGPNGRAVLPRINDIHDKVVRVVGTGSGVFEIIGKKSEIDAQPTFLEVTGSDASHTVRYGNLIRPTYIDDAGTTVTANIKTRLYDDTTAFVEENTITDGQYPEVFQRHTDLVGTITGDVALSDGALYAPYSLRSVSYGKKFCTAVISLEDTFAPATVLLDDLSITEALKATTDAYTTLETSAKLYDRAVSWLEDNITGEPAFLLSRTGVIIDAGTYDVILDPAASSVFDFASSTISADPGTVFTGSLTTTGDVTLSATMTDFNGDITATNVTVADGIDVTDATLVGTVNFTTAVDLTGVTSTGTIVYNDAVNRTITYDAVIANTVRNDGAGQITINLTNGATVTTAGTNVTTQTAPTPSTLTLTATANDIWAIYDDTNTFVTSGSDSTVYGNANTDTGTWSIVLHRLGHVAQIETWTADDDSNNLLTYDPAEILRPEGGPSYSGGSTTGLVTSRNGSDYIEVQIPDSLVTPQQVVDAQQDFLHTAAGLDQIFDTGRISAPTWGSLGGVVYLLSIEGFQYDSIPGVTPNSAVAAVLVSSATHASVLPTNGGTLFTGLPEVDPASLAKAVWDYLMTSATNSGSTGAALTIINDGVQNASLLIPHAQDLT